MLKAHLHHADRCWANAGGIIDPQMPREAAGEPPTHLLSPASVEAFLSGWRWEGGRTGQGRAAGGWGVGSGEKSGPRSYAGFKSLSLGHAALIWAAAARLNLHMLFIGLPLLACACYLLICPLPCIKLLLLQPKLGLGCLFHKFTDRIVHPSFYLLQSIIWLLGRLLHDCQCER